jgi:glycosyltransferase involved in cell wall biosynthesis
MVWVISEAEREHARSLAPKTPIAIVPLSIDIELAERPFSDRHGLLFLANFANNAGRHAVHWFARRVWPALKDQFPKLSLSVAGNDAALRLPHLGSGIRNLNFVPDAAELLLSHRVFVSPIHFGTGLATKNVLAMAHGLPVVTTSIGAQSLHAGSSGPLEIADHPTDFAQAVCRLYTDHNHWTSISAQSREHVRRFFSTAALEGQLESALCSAFSLEPKDVPLYYLRSRRMWIPPKRRPKIAPQTEGDHSAGALSRVEVPGFV